MAWESGLGERMESEGRWERWAASLFGFWILDFGFWISQHAVQLSDIGGKHVV